MSRETAETIIRRAFDEAAQVTFAFQGGEPTLWGLDNFRFFVETANKMNVAHKPVYYSFQTNGMLMDEEWASFFYKNQFFVGLSLDGYKDIHDLNRIGPAGKGSFNQVLKAAELLKKHKVEFNILSVVTAGGAKHAVKLYQFYKNQGFRHLQFIPCINDFDSTENRLTAEQYGHFLKTLFDCWYPDCMARDIVTIRYFDNILAMVAGYPPEQCSMSGICQCIPTIEADGKVYPCDFYVLDEWCLGDVETNSFVEMLATETARGFVAASQPVEEACRTCRWLNLCRGGCRRDREPVSGTLSGNRFCKAYQDFFDYTFERFGELWKSFS